MKVDPFAPQLIVDYDLFCRKHGIIPFGEYMARWYVVQALIESAEAEGLDPFLITVDDVDSVFPRDSVN